MIEKKEYLRDQLITYLGNKRALLDFIGEGIHRIRQRLGKDKLRILDMFSGSGIVARFFKQYADMLIVNDLEQYSAIINECYLSNESDLDIPLLREYYDELIGQLKGPLSRGIISGLYATCDDEKIQPNERVFYTARNAMYIDTARQLIEQLPPQYRKFFLAPLLSQASIHANTSGVFKGFYKNRQTGIGQFGGAKQDALPRITGDIALPFPVFSNFNCATMVCHDDANVIAGSLPEVDLAYIDPPYNQHPYGSNYFMLNVILDYHYPEHISRVSGIPKNWNRSDYNSAKPALRALSDLVSSIKSKYLMISGNSEGFISLEQMTGMLRRAGKLEILETKYNTFRGSRNLRQRDIHVKEYLFLLEK